MSESEAETKRQKAIEFLERIGGDADKLNPHRSLIRMTKSEMTETLDQLVDGLEEALDPELTREELVAKVKELADVASGETSEDEDEEDDEGDSDPK